MTRLALTVRPARTQDATAACEAVRSSIVGCCELDHGSDPSRIDAWLRNKTAANFLVWLASGGLHCVVLEEHGSVAGFGMASVEGELLLCYVRPEVKGLGGGKLLLQAMEAWAAAQGLDTLRLDSTRTALQFYRGQGYSDHGPTRHFAGMAAHPLVKCL